MSNWQVFIYSVIFYTVIFFIGKQIFDFLFKGFAPFISSRPWVIDQILQELRAMGFKGNFQAISIGSGRSGLIYAIEKNFPNVECIGIDNRMWSALIFKLQVFLHRSAIKVKYQELHRIDVSQADLIYCKLDLLALREFEKKFKFECKPGAVVLSNGFVIPNMPITKEINLERRKRRFSFFSGEIKSKSKKHKEENKVFVYVV